MSTTDTVHLYAEGEVQGACHAAFVDAGRAIDLVAGLVRAVRIDATLVAANLDRSCATITELADSLVREEQLSFRHAHEIAAATARAVVAAKSSLREAGYAPFCDAFQHATKRHCVMDEARFQEIVSPEHFVAVRTLPGGPAPAPMAAALAGYRAQAAQFTADARTIAEREASQVQALAKAFAALTE